MDSKKQRFITTDNFKKANELNDFFIRFDNNDPVKECEEFLQNIECATDVGLLVDPQEVTSLFRKICTKKSTGPDGISAYLLRECAEELTPAWCPIFQQSLDSHTVPLLWKKTIITPVPKKTGAVDNNDFRPIAITSVIMKCLKKYVMSRLKCSVNSLLDPLIMPIGRGEGLLMLLALSLMMITGLG